LESSLIDIINNYGYLGIMFLILVENISPPIPSDVGRILRTFKIKKNVEVTDNGKDNF